jgi:hypothetical protein
VGNRWRPAAVATAARVSGEEGAGLDNTCPREVLWGLGKLGEWLAGGERQRGMDLTGSGVNGAVVARDGARRGRRTRFK